MLRTGPASERIPIESRKASPNTTVSLGGAARPVGGLKFDTAAAPAYTIGSTAGDALVFDASAAVSVTNTVTTAQTVAAGVQLLGALTVSNAGTGGLAFTGSLSAYLWYRAARGVGAEPSLKLSSLLGLALVPLTIAAALGALAIVDAGAL